MAEYEYDGFSTDARLLLAENRFRNSKAFYEVHKEQINRLAIHPMRQIAAALSDDMKSLDEKMNLVPARMVSRVRRDTRFTKDKTLYRAHVWVLFMRPKAQWPYAPAFWFEIREASYGYGLGYYHTSPKLMLAYRNAVAAHSAAFRKALQTALAGGFSFDGEAYKKEKPGDVPEDLRHYYNQKDISLMKAGTDMERVEGPALMDDLRREFRALNPMYHFLMRASDALTAEEHKIG